MAAISWAFGVSGDWSNGAYWTGGVAPGPGDDVTIDAAHSLVLDDAGATLALSNGGALTIGSTLEVAAGTLQLNQGGSLTLGSTLDVVGGTVLLSGGVINGGTLSADGGSFVWNHGTLGGVTYEGNLTLSANVFLAVGACGLAVETAGGKGAGIVDLTGAGGTLDFVATQTFDDATIDLGSATRAPHYGWGPELYAAHGVTLTLCSHVQIDQVEKYANISGYGSQFSPNSDEIINQGTIEGNYNDGIGFIGAEYLYRDLRRGLATFSNQDGLNVDNGENVTSAAYGFRNCSPPLSVWGRWEGAAN